MLYVVDASAVLAYLRLEKGGTVLRDLLADVSNDLLIHSINLCEVYYDILRNDGQIAASNAIQGIYKDGILARADCDEAFWMDAGNLKVTPGRLSIADCFAIALARRLGCELITADHHEMDKLVGTGVVDLNFIR